MRISKLKLLPCSFTCELCSQKRSWYSLLFSLHCSSFAPDFLSPLLPGLIIFPILHSATLHFLHPVCNSPTYFLNHPSPFLFVLNPSLTDCLSPSLFPFLFFYMCLSDFKSHILFLSLFPPLWSWSFAFASNTAWQIDFLVSGSVVDLPSSWPARLPGRVTVEQTDMEG